VALQNEGKFYDLKHYNFNENIEKTVTNALSQQRILEKDDRTHQIIDPVFQSIQPNSIFDYRTPLYVAYKHFMGTTLKTPVFTSLPFG